MQNENLQRWFEEEFDIIENFAQDCGVDAEAALEHIATNRRRCRAKTRNKFIVWALKQVAKQPDFHVVSGIVRKFDLDVQNFLDKTTQGSSRYKDFPEYVKNNGNFLVNMGTRDDGSAIVWTIPEQYWDFVHKIYPVTLEPKLDGGYFIGKKIKGTIVPVHRLIFPVELLDTVQSNSPVEDYLDWSSLYVKNFNCSRIYEGKRINEYTSETNTAQQEFENSYYQPLIFTNEDGTQESSLDNFSAEVRYPSKIAPNADLGNCSDVSGKIKYPGKHKQLSKAERDEGLEDASERVDEKPTCLPSEAISKASLSHKASLSRKECKELFGDQLDSDAADLRQAWGL